LPYVANCSWDMHKAPAKLNSSIKFDIWHPAVVQKPTKPLKSVKDLDITFDLSPTWEWTLPSVANLSWDIYRIPKKIQISKLIFQTMMWASGAETQPHV
jgi:hypothetical protein